MTPERFEKLKRVLERRQPDLTVLADGVHKSHNISAILRSSDAVGVHGIHAVSPGGELRRHHMMAGGSKRWVDVVVHASIEDAVGWLKSRDWQIVVAETGPSARDYRDFDYTRRVAIGLGAELAGPSGYLARHADALVAIPMQGMVESLNVSVATAVILFEAARQRQAAGSYDRCRLDPDEYRRTLFEWSHPEVARRCRERGLDYPPLTADGDLSENPLSTSDDDR